MSNNVELNIRSGPDSLLVEIAEYVTKQNIDSELALSTARNCLIDTVGCGLLALTFPACTKMLGTNRARYFGAKWRQSSRH